MTIGVLAGGTLCGTAVLRPFHRCDVVLLLDRALSTTPPPLANVKGQWDIVDVSRSSDRQDAAHL